jgi:CheY-like chemotaxis protein
MSQEPDPPLRILVAEDDAALARLYVAYAQGRGHSILVAKDGAETLVLAQAEAPDVILLDVAMPKLDGRDVLKHLRASPRTAGIPVLVISAFGGDQHMRDLLLELGAWDVLEKPADLQIAFNKAERLVARAVAERRG